MKTFKEHLAEQANNKTYDISEHVDYIKAKMQACVEDREFTISLVQSKPEHIMAIGDAKGPIYQTFIPRKVEPHIYMKLFTQALKELGFRDEDIEKGAGDDERCYYYNIKVRW